MSTNDSASAMIERLVRQVLEQLNVPQANAAAEKSAVVTATNHAPVPAPQPHTHPLAGRLITLDSLQTLPPDVDSVVVGNRAVVTPAVQDELRRRKISLQRAAVESSTGTAPSMESAHSVQASLPCVVDTTDPKRGEALVRQLAMRGLRTQSIPAKEMPALVRHSGQAVIAISDLPAADIDQWGRGQGLISAAIDRPEEVSRVAKRLQPQVWVLDAERLTLSGMVAVAGKCLRLHASIDQQGGNSR